MLATTACMISVGGMPRRVLKDQALRFYVGVPTAGPARVRRAFGDGTCSRRVEKQGPPLTWLHCCHFGFTWPHCRQLPNISISALSSVMSRSKRQCIATMKTGLINLSVDNSAS